MILYHNRIASSWMGILGMTTFIPSAVGKTNFRIIESPEADAVLWPHGEAPTVEKIPRAIGTFGCFIHSLIKGREI